MNASLNTNFSSLVPTVNHQVNICCIANGNINDETFHHWSVEKLGAVELTFLVLYCGIASVGLFGNIIVLLVISVDHHLRSVPPYQLLWNLSFSDLIFTLLGPIHVYAFIIDQRRWFLGEIGCKLFYLTFRTMYVISVFLLVVLTVERYIALKHPLLHRRKKIPVRKIVAFVWIVSVLCCLPYFLNHTLHITDDGKYCLQSWGNKMFYEIYHYINYVLLFAFPLLMMLVLHLVIGKTLRKNVALIGSVSQRAHISSARYKLSKMLMVVVAAFFLCWSPYTIMEAVVVFKSPWQVPYEFIIGLKFAFIPVFASTAVNPICYCFMSAEFRKGVQVVFFRSRQSKKDNDRLQMNTDQTEKLLEMKRKSVDAVLSSTIM